MNYIHTKNLSPSQKISLLSLSAACQKHDRIHLSCPVNEGENFFLLYDNQNLISALTLFFPENDLCECSAFTQPEHRRRGHFSQLFDAALREIQRYEEELSLDVELCFPVDTGCPDTKAVLQALEAEFWYCEHLMSLSLNEMSNFHRSPFDNFIAMSRQSEHEYHFLLADSDAQNPAVLVGRCHLAIQNSSAYLYGFEITERLRKQGYGEACLWKQLSVLTHSGIRRITLQVSGENAPALALYKKAGFQITETLSYYLY